MEMPSYHRRALTHYLDAKDHHRPFLLRGAFVDGAKFDLVVGAETPFTKAAAAAKVDTVLETVQSIGVHFLDVYTSVSAESVRNVDGALEADWVVVLVARELSNVVLNWGSYRFVFNDDNLVETLQVIFHGGAALPPETYTDVVGWISGLPAPVFEVSQLESAAPPLPIAANVLSFFSSSQDR